MTETGDGGAARRTERERARYLAEVFGDVLPETTSDDRDPESRRGDDRDSWYRENRPPHHDEL